MTIERCDRITDIVSLCGGGVPAVFYATGILYALHKSGKLMETVDGVKVLNQSLLFTSSSGGVVPLLLLQYVIHNDLHNLRDDWFEHYIVKTMDKINTVSMSQIYISAILKSMAVYNGSVPELVRICNDIVKNLILDILPKEIIDGKPVTFYDLPCFPFKYNYVVDSAFNDSPVVSNDFTHLNNINVVSQITEVMITCCIALSFSYLTNGTLNDAALLIDNDVLCLENYVNLKHLYYYSLKAYDAKTNDAYRDSNIFTVSNFDLRTTRIYNYRAINNLKLYASKRTGEQRPFKFHLVTFPNKYDPILKYDNKIYRDLVPNMFYQIDYPTPLAFLGIFNGDSRMLQLMFLVGAFETLSVYGEPTETADTLTDTLTAVYKEALDNPYDIYFKKDPFSVISRLLFSII
jgi:hypothetical protein